MSYAVFGDWLAKCVDQCTCYGGEFGHEPGCGYEPVAKISEIEAVLGTVAVVRGLHRPHESPFSGNEKCLHCGYAWPCPTIVALKDAVGRLVLCVEPGGGDQ